MKLTKEICDLIWTERNTAIHRFIFCMSVTIVTLLIAGYTGYTSFLPNIEFTTTIDLVITIALAIIIGMSYVFACVTAGMYMGILICARTVRDEKLHD